MTLHNPKNLKMNDISHHTFLFLTHFNSFLCVCLRVCVCAKLQKSTLPITESCVHSLHQQSCSRLCYARRQLAQVNNNNRPRDQLCHSSIESKWDLITSYSPSHHYPAINTHQTPHLINSASPNIDTVRPVPFIARQRVSQASVSSQLVPSVFLVNNRIPSWKVLLCLSNSTKPLFHSEDVKLPIISLMACHLIEQFSPSFPEPLCLNINIMVMEMRARGWTPL